MDFFKCKWFDLMIKWDTLYTECERFARQCRFYNALGRRVFHVTSLMSVWSKAIDDENDARLVYAWTRKTRRKERKMVGSFGSEFPAASSKQPIIVELTMGRRSWGLRSRGERVDIARNTVFRAKCVEMNESRQNQRKLVKLARKWYFPRWLKRINEKAKTWDRIKRRTDGTRQIAKVKRSCNPIFIFSREFLFPNFHNYANLDSL